MWVNLKDAAVGFKVEIELESETKKALEAFCERNEMTSSEAIQPLLHEFLDRQGYFDENGCSKTG